MSDFAKDANVSCEDTISRQAAIEAIGKTSDELYENIKKGATFPQRQWFDGMAQAQSILENLPSAQPERKKGKWIERWHDNKHVIGDMACSVCGAQMLLTFPRFCPCCGAYMRGEQDG